MKKNRKIEDEKIEILGSSYDEKTLARRRFLQSVRVKVGGCPKLGGGEGVYINKEYGWVKILSKQPGSGTRGAVHSHPPSQQISNHVSFVSPRVLVRCFMDEFSLSSVHFGSVQFSSAQFSSVQFTSVQFSSVHFSAIQFGSVRIGSVYFSSFQFCSLQLN